MNQFPWIDRQTAERVASEVRKAFGMEDLLLEEERYKYIRQELYLYYPDDLLVGIPYTLLGYLQFGVPTDADFGDLIVVLQFLNIESHPYVDPESHIPGLSESQQIAQEKKSSVAGLSREQARAIRVWLEAIKDCGIFWYDTEELDYALAYWRQHEESRV